MMKLERFSRIHAALSLAIGLVVLQACGGESQSAPESGSQAAIVKGGDDRTGEYEAVEDWWKPAPDHEGPWGWGEVSGVAVDTPDRILVGIWGDRDGQGREREGRRRLEGGRACERGEREERGTASPSPITWMKSKLSHASCSSEVW
ncbi:MAG TPA: hypothetical protein EYQ64_00185, partial [Gemmatimonadetes bacterium]|nr:hypothetical protein [Gemmatimonadota bacterium]